MICVYTSLSVFGKSIFLKVNIYTSSGQLSLHFISCAKFSYSFSLRRTPPHSSSFRHRVPPYSDYQILPQLTANNFPPITFLPSGGSPPCSADRRRAPISNCLRNFPANQIFLLRHFLVALCRDLTIAAVLRCPKWTEHTHLRASKTLQQ